MDAVSPLPLAHHEETANRNSATSSFAHSDRFCKRAQCGPESLTAACQPPADRAGFGWRVPAGLPGLRPLSLGARFGRARP